MLSDQDEVLIISDPRSLSRGNDGSFALRYIADAGSGAPLPRPPPPVIILIKNFQRFITKTQIWIPGKENRPFRGVVNKGGVIEKFILNAIPR